MVFDAKMRPEIVKKEFSHWLTGPKAHGSLFVICAKMEHGCPPDCPGPVASLNTLQGPLLIYSQQALVAICAGLPTIRHNDAQPSALMEGFTSEQWAAYGRRKASIASRYARRTAGSKPSLIRANRSLPVVLASAMRSKMPK